MALKPLISCTGPPEYLPYLQLLSLVTVSISLVIVILAVEAIAVVITASPPFTTFAAIGTTAVTVSDIAIIFPISTTMTQLNTLSLKTKRPYAALLALYDWLIGWFIDFD